MKNKKILMGILSGALALTMLLTGCNNGGETDSSDSSDISSLSETNSSFSGNSDNSNNSGNSGNSGNSADPDNSGYGMPTYGASVSVADIKNAYGAADDDIMPLYNVEPDETFEFNFKADWLGESDVPDSLEIVTVHTHPSCSEESMLYIGADIEQNSDGGTRFTISPIGGVLSTDTEDHNMIHNDVEVWGNAQMYYIAIWYDTEADKFEKLTEPVVIPFTVKHELGVPTLKGNVDKDGRFKLMWDAVEGADGYRVYKFFSTEINRTGEFNKPVAGAEKAFDVHGDCYLIRDDETTETEFDCFAGKDHGLAIHYHNDLDEDDTDYILGQNYSVNGSYFVTALFGDKESGLSNIVHTSDLILPFRPIDEDDLMFKNFESEADLPQTMRVLNIDGSVTERSVRYSFHWGKTLTGMAIPQYRYSVEGTTITGIVDMEFTDGKLDQYKDKQEGDAPAGFVDGSAHTSAKAEPENDSTFNPEADVPTIIESAPSDENASLVERQIENTEKHVESGNAQTVDNSEYPVFADSAEEEWLARNLIAGNNRISLEAFPGLQTYETLYDTVMKVYYQNPYVLGMTAYKYDYAGLALDVKYCYSASELSERQSEILEESNNIVSGVISAEMSDEEKCRALYNYFNAHTVYDDAALEEADKFGYTKGEGWKDAEDAFNAYGVIVKKTGVCQSYALSYKLLCVMSGVEAKVITGYLDATLPHAWNAVNLDGEWYQTDCTNNETNCGIPFFLYEAGEDILAITGYTEDKLYELDLAAGRFAVDDSDREYYASNGLCAADIDEYKTVLANCLENTNKVIAIRCTGERFTKEEIVRAVAEVYSMKGRESELQGLGLGMSNSFIILVSE